MSVMKENEILGQSSTQADSDKEAARLAKLRESLGPKFFKASRKSLERFDALYRLLAK